MIDIYELLRRDQDGTSDYVCEKLTEMEIKFSIDTYGNIYNVDNENAPLLSAHMDTVRNESDICMGAFLENSETEETIFSGGVLGGDDKCGVYLILRALESGEVVNFIFSRDEEKGCLGISAFFEDTTNKELVKKNCLYGLVLDRRGNTDIICEQNDYGTKEFENALVNVSLNGNFGYKPERGLMSDANYISDYISCANLSTGYWKPHSVNEYIVKKDLENCFEYVIAILTGVRDKFDAPTKKRSYSDYKSYGSSKTYYYGDYDWDYYGNYGYNTHNSSDPLDNRECELCNTIVDETYEVFLPNGLTVHLCEECVDDMIDQLLDIRSEIRNKRKAKADSLPDFDPAL